MGKHEIETPATATGIYRVRSESVLETPCKKDGLRFYQRSMHEQERWMHAASLRTGSGVELMMRRMGSVQRTRYLDARNNIKKRITSTNKREHGETIITFTFID